MLRGCVACHDVSNAGMPSRTVLRALGSKYSGDSLVSFLGNHAETHPGGGCPI